MVFHLSPYEFAARYSLFTVQSRRAEAVSEPSKVLRRFRLFKSKKRKHSKNIKLKYSGNKTCKINPIMI